MISKIFEIVSFIIIKTIWPIIQFCWSIIKSKFNIKEYKSCQVESDIKDSNPNDRAHSSLVSTPLYQSSSSNQVGSCHYVHISYAIQEKEFIIDVIDLRDWNAFNNSYFYHYTSLKCARQILQSRRIIAKVPKVKRFGKNVFFTKCKPDLNDYQIVTNNYIHYSTNYLNNIQCAFAFHRYDLVLNKVSDNHKRDIWTHADDIDLNQTDFKVIIRQPHYRYHLNI